MTFKEELLTIPQVRKVSYSNEPPGGNFWYWSVSANEMEASVRVNAVDPDFITIYGLKILEGRDFDWELTTDRDNKFIITEWVTEERRNELLAETDIYLALFSARSSSLSLATAIGAHRIIIATALPFSQEMVENTPIMCITPSDSKSIIENINRIANDNALQNTYLKAIDKYIKQHSFREMSKKLTEIYKGIAS